MENKKQIVRKTKNARSCISLPMHLFQRLYTLSNGNANGYLSKYVLKGEECTEKFEMILEKVSTVNMQKEQLINSVEKYAKANQWEMEDIFVAGVRKVMGEEKYRCDNCKEEFENESIKEEVECPNCGNKEIKIRIFNIRLTQEIMNNYIKLMNEFNITATELFSVLIQNAIMEVEKNLPQEERMFPPIVENLYRFSPANSMLFFNSRADCSNKVDDIIEQMKEQEDYLREINIEEGIFNYTEEVTLMDMQKIMLYVGELQNKTLPVRFNSMNGDEMQVIIRFSQEGYKDNICD